LSVNAKDLLSASNIVLIITGIYFAAIAGLHEGSIYSIIGTVLCFVAVGLSAINDSFFTAPWRIATVAFSITVLVAQVISNASALTAFNGVVVASTLINGALVILLLGVLLSSAKEITTREEEEEEPQEEEKKESKKKLTYEI
jgi:hypothetical protein